LNDSTIPTEEHISLSQLATGDRLIIRNGELIPADATLIEGSALIDYSFVTGESEPVAKCTGEHLYAGGRQIGGAIEIRTVKAVSQSYLTSLWNQEAFRKDKTASFTTLINTFSYRFTWIVISLAIGAALFWIFNGDAARGLKAFTSVLIVACPCALALAAPFTLGTAIRVLSRHNVFVKSPEVVEGLAKVDSIVFDKTGTLTAAGAGSIQFIGAALNEQECRAIRSAARHSTHPLAVRIADALSEAGETSNVRSVAETTGCGIEATVNNREIRLGSAAWLESFGIATPRLSAAGSTVHLAINGSYRGHFVLSTALRPEVADAVRNLSGSHQLALLSGDNEREREQFVSLFGSSARVQFNQSPADKLAFVRSVQAEGRTVMMVGDGLNDAGALRQSDVGVAVVESISAFSPSSDVIMAASMVPRLDATIRFSKAAARIVRASFIVSTVYNVVGVSIAAAGYLAPVVCAILMPLSSITVVVFACGLTTFAAKRTLNRLEVESLHRGATAGRSHGLTIQPFDDSTKPLPEAA
jgi:P-type Cu+ transporter